MQTTQLIEIAIGAITDLETIQNILDANASRTTTKREANDLGFLVGLNGKLSNDVNPWNSGPLALSFDHGFEEAQLDLDEFHFSDDDSGDREDCAQSLRRRDLVAWDGRAGSVHRARAAGVEGSPAAACLRCKRCPNLIFFRGYCPPGYS